MSRRLLTLALLALAGCTPAFEEAVHNVIPPEQLRAAKRILALLATYQEIEDLVNIGAYVSGVNTDFDAAVQARPKILQYLQQDAKSPATLDQSRKQLIELGNWIEQMEKSIRAQAGKTPREKLNAAV